MKNNLEQKNLDILDNSQEQSENLEVILDDLEEIKNEIVNDIEEIGGEENFEKLLSEDQEKQRKIQNIKDKIFMITVGLASASIAGVFGEHSLSNMEGESLSEKINSLANIESLMSFIGALFTVLAFMRASQIEKEKNSPDDKNLDQI